MIDMVFPAKRIKKGSRIVIWGANIAGECFYEQIMSLKHASVITFIDSRMKRNHLKLSVNSPEWLRTNQTNYDYILIGSVRTNVQDEIKDVLLKEYNVPENKIVCDGYMLCIRGSGIADIDSPCEIVDMLNKFGKNKIFVDEPIQYIIEAANKSKKILRTIKKLFNCAESSKTKLTCAYILFYVNAWDGAIFKETMKELKRCVSDNPMWAHYFMFGIVQTAVMRFPEYKYYHYFLDRKRIMYEISKSVYKEKRRERPREKKKIAIASAAPLLGGDWHITKLVAQVANGLREKGYEVAVFVESKVYSNREFFINTYLVNTKGLSIFEESNKRAFADDIPVFYSKGESMSEHANDYVDKIIEYNPNYIIYFTADSTCATKVLYELFPIVSLPTTIFGVCAYFHCIAYPDISLWLEMNEKYPWIEEKQELLESCQWIFPAVNKVVYNREDKGWKKDDFIVVTVGNRLEYDLTDEFIDAICYEVEKDKTLKWVIVGCSFIPYINTKYYELVQNRKIEYISYENDLIALYKIVNAYINPTRNGGGISIAWAMQVGIPVITLDAITDGVEWLGRENAVKGDYNDLVYELRKLIHKKNYYRYKSRRMIERAKKWDCEVYLNRIIEISNRAVELFNGQKESYEKETDI